MNRRLRTTLVAVCATTLLVSCGGGDEDPAPEVETSASVSPDEDETDDTEPDAEPEAEDDAAEPDTDSEVDDEAKPYVDAIAKASSAGQFALDAEQSQCFGTAVVESVGLKKLKSKGGPDVVGKEFENFELVALGLTSDEGEDVYDSLGSCGYDVRSDLLASLLEGEDDEKTRSCIEDAVEEERLREFVVTMMTDGEQAAQTSKPWKDLEAALGSCEPTPAP